MTNCGFTGGHLYLQIMKEKLQLWLNSLRSNILKLSVGAGTPLSLTDIQKAARRCGGLEISMENFLATGKINEYLFESFIPCD